ncbi:inorganic phosphate transporter [Isoptericola sediminis]|uniref:Phosphate transporter n=1 Tax=Isoptericola sediminis TaxID=2733572 RepID=A0A849JVF1_9MICO|nr:inorganic phosphate transporter [Isoptericola sediminis]NNU26574.1 inorganic phosphate transporter [Isoptericola sediminis]
MGGVTETLLLVLVVVTALAFDFTNGFHDTGNAMATSIATRALRPRTAVLLSAVLNMAGAFLSLAVAATIAKGLVDAGAISLEVVFAGLVGGIVWNLVTWLFGLPSSSSHALVGGVVGSVLAAAGTEGVLWTGVVAKVLVPALLAPVVAIGVAATGTYLVARLTRGIDDKVTGRAFRWGQVGSASLVSLAHGTNDAQKSMGIILLALITAGAVPADSSVPFWVIFSCAFFMALGTYLGGWRIIRTLGKGLVEIDSRQGMAAETSSAAVILLSSYFGFSLSTTHVATGSIMGSGVGMPGATVRWGVAGRMLSAWALTLPAAGIVGAACYGIQHGVGGLLGTLLVLALLVGAATAIWVASRRRPVNHTNVNEQWDERHDGGLRRSVTAPDAAAPDVTTADAAGTDAPSEDEIHARRANALAYTTDRPSDEEQR